MAHNKYIRRGDKEYGPYLYENKRVNGKVVTSYHGAHKGKNRNLTYIFIAVFLALAGGAFLYYQGGLTGKASFEIDIVYEEGEPLDGELRFRIKEGELVPLDSIVVVNYAGETKSFPLSDLVSENTITGDFFAEGSTLSGSGEGYGAVGNKVITPDVNFEMRVFSSDSGETQVSGGGGSGGGDGGEEGSEETTTEETVSEEVSGEGTAAEETTGEGAVEESSEETTAEDSSSDSESDAGSDTSSDNSVTSEDSSSTSSDTGTSEASSESSGDSGADSGESESGSDSGSSDSGGASDSGDSGGDSGGGESSSDGGDSGGDGGGDSGGGDGGDGGITGAVVTEDEYTISGTVSLESDFDYIVEPGQRAEIVSGSVNAEGEALPDGTVSLSMDGTAVTVSTQYFINEEGFGEEFLSDDFALTLYIDIKDLGLTATPGNLEVDLEHDGAEISSHTEPVAVLASEEELIELVGNETNETEIAAGVISQTQEIPSVRIPLGGSADVNLGNYFSGAEAYAVEVSDISADFNGAVMTLSAGEFRGARKARVIASLADGSESLASNEFTILASSGAVSIKTTRSKVVAGSEDNVKVRKEITLETPEEISVEIPKDSLNVEVEEQDAEGNVIKKEAADVSEIGSSVLAGNVVTEVQLGPDEFSLDEAIKNIVEKIKKAFRSSLTGNVVEGVSEKEKVAVAPTEETKKVVVSFEVPSPGVTQEFVDGVQRVKIEGDDNYAGYYEDVIASVNLREPIAEEAIDKLKVKWVVSKKKKGEITAEKITKKAGEVLDEQVVEEESVETELGTGAEEGVAVEEPAVESNESENNDTGDVALTGNLISGSIAAVEQEVVSEDKTEEAKKLKQIDAGEFVKQDVDYDAYDLDEDGEVDYLEWVVPHLSEQTYEIVIEISNAEHLDEEREFVSDIFDEVFALDGVWSETIPENHYVRVVFEENLTSINDITLYPRFVNGTPRVEVYEFNGTEVLASFDNLQENSYNKVYLTNLTGEQDTFDLLILEGSLEFDHIIDPTIVIESNGTSDRENVTSQDGFSHITLNDTSTLLYMPFDLNESLPQDYSDTYDSSSLTGEAHWVSDGWSGGGFSFDGDDRINLPSVTLNMSNGYAFGGWVNPSQLPGTSVPDIVIRYRESGNNEIFIRFQRQGNGNLRIDHICDLGNNPELASLTNQDYGDFEGLWTHIVAVYDTSNCFLYINGALEASPANAVAPTTVDFAVSRLGEGLEGVLDDTFLLNRSLSGAEVLALYNNQSYRFVTPATQFFPSSNSGFDISQDGTLTQLNVTTNTTQLQGTSMQLRITEWDSEGSETGTSAWQDVPDGDNQDVGFTIDSGTYNVTLEFNYSAGSNNFYTPLLENFIILNSSVGAESDTTVPLISYGVGTESNGSSYSRTNIYVNVSVTEDNEDSVTFLLHNSTAEVNSTSFTDSTRTINWTGLSAETYYFNVSVNDTAGNSNTTETRTITITSGNLFVGPTLEKANQFVIEGLVDGALEDGSFYSTDQIINVTNETDGTRLQLVGLFSDGNVNLSGLYLNFSRDKTVVNVSDISGTGDNHTLFIPNDNDGSLYVCPNAVLLSEVTPSCSGIIRFSNPELAAGTWKGGVRGGTEGGDYKVENLTGSGISGDDENPQITFGSGTSAAGTQDADAIYVNLSTNDSSRHYSFTDFDSDVVLWMRMDDVVSGNPIDLSSHGNNGTLEGNALINETGRFGNSTFFDGTNDFINISYSESLDVLDGNGEFSVFMWVYPIVSAGNKYFLDQAAGSGTGRTWLKSRLFGGTQFQTALGGSTTQLSTSGLSTNTWQHIGFTYNGSDFMGYFNAVNEVNATASGSVDSGATGDYFVGAGQSLTNDFNGYIDEILVFNRSLTATEVGALYNASTTQYVNNFTNLASGSHSFTGYAVDAAGNRNDTGSRSVSIDAVPTITLNSPTNASVFELSVFNITMNATLNDDSNGIEAIIYGRNESDDPDGYNINFDSNDPFLLYKGSGLNSGEEIIYNYTTLPVRTNGNFFFIFHFDNETLGFNIDNCGGEGYSDIHDFSGVCNTASFGGNANYNITDGKFGWSAGFDGSTDTGTSVDTNFVASTVSSSDFSLSAWVQCFGDNTDGPIISSGTRTFTTGAGTGWFEMSLDENKSQIRVKKDSSTAGASVTGNVDVCDGNWHFIAGVFDRNANGEIYVDGELDNSDSISPGNGAIEDSEILTIGYARNTIAGTNPSFNGNIDDAALMSGLMTETQIKNLYRSSPAKYLWKVNATDSSGVNVESSELEFTISDTTEPLISYGVGTESDGSTFSRTNIYVNVSVTEELEDTITFLLHNSTGQVNSSAFVDGTRTINWTGLSDGTYTFNVSVNDTAGNLNTTATRTVTIDTAVPVVTINLPSFDGINLSTSSVGFNVTTNENATALYSLNGGVTNITMQSNGNRDFNATNGSIADGTYTVRFYVNDTAGNLNSTSMRVFSIDATIPLISFGVGTENNGDYTDLGIYANVSVNETNEGTIVFNLYNSSGLVNSTSYDDGTRDINWTGLADGFYEYNITINDTSGNSNTTSTRGATTLSSCLLQCTTEGEDCTINNACVLHNGLCSGGVCDFGNFVLNAELYTLYDSSGNGRNLNLNLSGNVTFLIDNTNVSFSGKNGSDISPGTVGGNASVVNITVTGLFNTTNGQFIGRGGYSSLSGADGGNGGILQLNYHGLIRKFSDIGDNPLENNAPVFTAGSSVDSGSGTIGTAVYNKDSAIPRDVDINNDGRIDSLDRDNIEDFYNNVTEDSTFNQTYDINDDGKLNILDLVKVGFEWQTR